MVFHGVPFHLEQMLRQTSKLGSIGSTWKLQARWCWTMMRAGLQRSLARPLFLASRASEVCEACCTIWRKPSALVDQCCFWWTYLEQIIEHPSSQNWLFAREKLKITTGDRLVPASVDVRLSDELQRFLKDVPVDALGLPRRSLGARCAMVAILRGTSGI